jgi:hypothetical protein
MKFARFVFFVAIAAAIGVGIAKCNRGESFSPVSCQRVAGNVDCPLATHNPTK